jgi:hypothetical protein
MKRFRSKFLKKYYQVIIDIIVFVWYKTCFAAGASMEMEFCAYRVGLFHVDLEVSQGW